MPRNLHALPEAVTGKARWIGPVSQGALDNGDAQLEITVDLREPCFYFVAELKANGRRVGFRLVKIADLEHTATYTLTVTAGSIKCDCPDAQHTFRPGGAFGCPCKHARGLSAALKAAKL
jgi:hypothetical protein